jgi:uncharacterized phage protein gp47/JayE
LYENMTYETILKSMLDRVSDNMDKREGSIIYDALAPAAYELSNAYMALEEILFCTFANTAEYDFLEKRAMERGLTRKEATYAVLKGTFNMDIDLNATFAIGDYTYTAFEKISTGVYKMRCNKAGAEPNSCLGALLPTDYIEGLASAELTELLTPGEDEESDDALRERYYSSLDSEAFGGNASDYKEKVTALAGVGGVKVYPVWDGGGTVKIVFTNSDYEKPSAALVSDIQTAVDPSVNAGEGAGVAPIGHVVTVEGVSETTVNITATITYETGYAWADVKTSVENAIDAYFLELAESWQNETCIVARVSRIETRLLDIMGILDVESTTLNGTAANLTLEDKNIPIRGTFNGE